MERLDQPLSLQPSSGHLPSLLTASLEDVLARRVSWLAALVVAPALLLFNAALQGGLGTFLSVLSINTSPLVPLVGLAAVCPTSIHMKAISHFRAMSTFWAALAVQNALSKWDEFATYGASERTCRRSVAVLGAALPIYACQPIFTSRIDAFWVQLRASFVVYSLLRFLIVIRLRIILLGANASFPPGYSSFPGACCSNVYLFAVGALLSEPRRKRIAFQSGGVLVNLSACVACHSSLTPCKNASPKSCSLGPTDVEPESETGLQVARFGPLAPLMNAGSELVQIRPGSVAAHDALQRAVLSHLSENRREGPPSHPSVASTSDFLTDGRTVRQARRELSRFRCNHQLRDKAHILLLGLRDRSSRLATLNGNIDVVLLIVSFCARPHRTGVVY